MTVRWLFIMPMMFILVVLSPQSFLANEPYNQMKFHFIDVGQGDSMLIQTPRNKTILIDGGPPESEKQLMTYLEKQQIEEIDLLIVTHPDIDHIGGLPKLMRSIKVKQILDSGKLHTTRVYHNYVKEVLKQKIPVKLAKQNERIPIDPELDVKVLNTYNYFKTNNEASIALHVQFQDVDFLLMGDVEAEQEKKMIEQHNLEADIVKVAHHGSNTSSSMKFLQAIQPETALISYGKDNEFGHPHEEVVERLVDINASIYSTATYGNIMIQSNGKSYMILTEKSPVDGLLDHSE